LAADKGIGGVGGILARGHRLNHGRGAQDEVAGVKETGGFPHRRRAAAADGGDDPIEAAEVGGLLRIGDEVARLRGDSGRERQLFDHQSGDPGNLLHSCAARLRCGVVAGGWHHLHDARAGGELDALAQNQLVLIGGEGHVFGFAAVNEFDVAGAAAAGGDGDIDGDGSPANHRHPFALQPGAALEKRLPAEGGLTPLNLKRDRVLEAGADHHRSVFAEERGRVVNMFSVQGDLPE